MSKMKEYQICIEEQLGRVVKIKAVCAGDAIREVRRMYKNEEIVLDDGDYVDTEFSLL